MEEIEISVQASSPEFLPVYSSEHAAGADLKACIPEQIVLEPGASVLVPTGLRMAIPEGFEVQIRPRSGLAAKFGISMVNAPGTIDADYRGEIRVILINHGREPFTIRRGDRIAQMVIAPVLRVNWRVTATLDATVRGDGGFGSTGV